MFFAASVYSGKPGKWELLRDGSELESRHMFKSSLELDPVQTEIIKGVSYPKKGISHKYKGPFPIDLDINKKKGLVEIEQVRKLTVKIMNVLSNRFKLDPKSNGVKIYFSGSKGYHIEVDSAIFGMKKDVYYPGLPHIYKNLAIKLQIDKVVDMSIYSSGWGRLWRRPNIKRDNGRHKIPLSFDELLNMHSDEHVSMSQNTRLEPPAMNGVNRNLALSRLFKSSYDMDKVRKSTGLSSSDFKQLIPAVFEGSDCISKILNAHPSLNKSVNFHHTSFVLVTYFVNMSYSFDRTKEAVGNWIKAVQSQTYNTETIRWEHFKSNFDQVSGGGYKFSCGAARNIVEYAYCATCPLNKDPDWSSKSTTGGVIEWEGTYKTGQLDKSTGEWLPQEKSNGIFVPTSVGISAAGNVNQIFNCHIEYSDRSKSNELSLDFLEFSSEENLTKHVQVANGVGGNIWSPFCLSKKNFQGVRLIVGQRMKNLPHYLSTGATHGAFKFKEKWYWADNEGARDKDWKASGNVMCDQPYSAGGEDSYFNQHLTAHEPFDRKNKPDFIKAIRTWKMIEKINSPHIMYLVMGWAVASFFRPRFFDLKSKVPNPNIHTFPLLFHIGKAQTGKTTLDNEVLIPLMGYGTESFGEHDSPLVNIKLFALSCFSLFMHISKASNGCPIFLDEFKDEFSGDDRGTVKFKRTDLDTLCRLSYDRSAFTRGNAQLGLESNTISSTFKINTPKLGMNSLDQASYQRSIMVYADEGMSQKYTKNFEQFYKAKTGTNIMQRIGATISKFAISASDEKLKGMLEQSGRFAERFFPTGGSRRKEGLAKIIFGNLVIKSLFSKHAWDFDTSVKVCAMAYSYMDDGPDAQKEKEDDYGMSELTDLISSDGRGGRSDWEMLLSEILDLTAVRSESHKLAHKSEYYFEESETVSGDFNLVLNIKIALDKIGTYRRATNAGSGIIMSTADFRIGAKTTRILVKHDGKDFEPFGFPDGNQILRGEFVRLSVRGLLSFGIELKGIPGSEDPLYAIEEGM